METHKDLIYPRVCEDPLFYFLHTLKFKQTLVLDTPLKKLFFLTNIINLHCVKISTYNKHKNEQLDKKPAIFCFRQVVDKRPQSGQGLYRPLGCKKGLNWLFLCRFRTFRACWKAYFTSLTPSTTTLGLGIPPANSWRTKQFLIPLHVSSSFKVTTAAA